MSVSTTDDLTGVQYVYATFLNPSGTVVHAGGESVSPPATNFSGTFDITFPQFSEVGTWTVYYVYLPDAVGNVRYLYTADLVQLRFPTELVVIGQAEDTTPPMITVSANPTTLWPPNGKMVPVTISGTITDLESGVNASTATFEVKDEYGLIQPSGQITTLDATTGSYTFRIQLQASRNGNDRDGRHYTIIVSAQDMEGNIGSMDTIVTVPQNQGQGQGIAAR